MLILGFSEYASQAQALAEALDAPYQEVHVHRFPDGEALVRLPQTLPEQVVFCRSLNDPDTKLIELILAAETARTLGARRLTLAAPYLCYMRQDRAFHPGEAVSQRIIGRLLAGHFDALVSVDPHLHRTPRLEDAVPVAKAVALSAAPAIGRFLQDMAPGALLLGPDEESEQWVAAAARSGGFEHGAACKERLGDRRVRIRLPDLDYQDRQVVLLDDVASSGETLAEAARGLLARGAARVDAAVTHALLAEGAEARMQGAGIAQFWSTDSIPHPSNAIALAPLLAGALQED